MDAYGDLSDLSFPESQATQLIKDVLAVKTPPGSNKINTTDRIPSNLSNPPLPASNATSGRDPGPPTYHYHGLALTQTQPPVGKTKATALKITAVHSLRPPSRPNKPSGSNHNHFSGDADEDALSSQDSFGGAISQDPIQQFIAHNPAFDIPLSQLVRPSSIQESQLSGAITTPSFGSSIRVVPPNGRVLVENTPSDTGNSPPHQSPPADLRVFADPPRQEGSRTQNLGPGIGDRPVEPEDNSELVNEAPASQRDDLSQISSSYERFMRGEAELEAAKIAEPVQLEATQPSDDAGDLSTAAQIASTPPYEAPGPSDMSTNPRSIISMVDPRKAWRYTRAAQARAEAQRTAPPRKTAEPVAGPTPPNPLQPEVQTKVTSSDVVPETPQPTASKESTTAAQYIPQPAGSGIYAPSPRKTRQQVAADVVLDPKPPEAADPLTRPGSTKKPKRKTAPKKLPPIIDAGEDELVPDSVMIQPEEVEEDVPLAAVFSGKRPATNDQENVNDDDGTTAKKGKGKGKGKTPAKGRGRRVVVSQSSEDDTMPPPPTKGKRPVPTKRLPARATKGKAKEVIAEASDAPIKEHQTRGTAAKRKRNATIEVPSSVPDQDRKRGASKTGKEPITPVRRLPTTRSTSTATSMAKKRKISSRSHDVLPVLQQGSSKLAKSEEPTEPDFESEIEDFESEADVVGPSSLKKSNQVSRTATITAKSNNHSFAVSRRGQSMSRHRALLGDRILRFIPTKVMALWKQDGHFYSGVIQKHLIGTQYVVQFDDRSEDTVVLSNMRRCELKEGDAVIVGRSDRRGTVAQVFNRSNQQIVSIILSRGKDGEDVEVGLEELRVAARTIATEWKDRILDAKSIVTREDAERGYSTSSILSKTALVTTVAPGPHGSELKKEVRELVESNGGIVLEDFSDVISMNGKWQHSKKQWTAEGKDVVWKGRDIDRLFLLSDDASQKPKYLEALALGVPCLSMNWLHDSIVGHEESPGVLDWHPYLLPQGYANALNARVSQFVDLNWCNSHEHLEQIMNNAVASKPLKGKSILCIQTEFLPENKKAMASPVSRIMLAMGANRLEVVSEEKYASQELSEYDYLVVREDEELMQREDVVCVNFAWIKGCLIAGRLIDLPTCEG